MTAVSYLRNASITLCLLAPSLLLAQQGSTPNCTTDVCNAEPEHTDGEPAVAIVREFLARHKDFVVCHQNATAMTAYLETHHLNPLAASSFERAFQDLREHGQLRIASK